MSNDLDRVCCNCKHNIRTGEVPHIESHCDIDGSYISYLQCIEGTCKKWEAKNETHN